MKINGITFKRVTKAQHEEFKQAAINTLKKIGRPYKEPSLKYKAISIKLAPEILDYFKAKAKKTGKGYQTLINEVLLKATKKAA